MLNAEEINVNSYFIKLFMPNFVSNDEEINANLCFTLLMLYVKKINVSLYFISVTKLRKVIKTLNKIRLIRF